MDMTLTKRPANQRSDNAEKTINGSYISENVQGMTQQGVAASRDFYAKIAAAAEHGTKSMAEIVEETWTSTKELNEKIVQNMTANAKATLDAAQAISAAKSLPEIATLQSEFAQRFATQTAEQTKEFFELSTRTTQRMMDKAQVAAADAFKAKD